MPVDTDKESAYLARLVWRLRKILGDSLVGVYVGGSYALGDYRPGRSDLDVAAVVADSIPAELKRRIAAAVSHKSLPCPGRGVELVVYRLATARSGSASPDFELNLNSGRGMRTRIELEPGGEGHWFPIDRSILAQAGISLTGPPAADVFAPIGREVLRPVLAESIAWHGRNAGPPGDDVLNACRALRFVSEGMWSSKAEAGRWALERGAFAERTLLAALAARDR